MGKVAFAGLLVVSLIYLCFGVRFIVLRKDKYDVIIGSALITGSIQLATTLALYFNNI